MAGPEGAYAAEVVQEGDAFLVTVNGVEHRIKLKPAGEHDIIIAEVSERPVHVRVLYAGSRGVELVLGGERVFFEAAAPAQASLSTPAIPSGLPRPPQDRGVLTSPMPGKVMSIMAQKGDQVSQGDAIVVIESMKMEVAVRSDRDGTLESVLVSEGDSVKKGQALVRYRD